MSKVVIVCGAGLSALSGIPTYRDNINNNGLWNINDMKKICTKGNEFTKESIDFYNNFRKLLKNINPSKSHYELARLQNLYGSDKFIIFTQNIDDLLERAGCTEVKHIHGKVCELRCENCNNIKNIGYNEIKEKYCEYCNKRYRNNIVFYGEKGNYQELLETILDMNEQKDIFVLLGTSCEAINIDMIIKPLKYKKIYINPIIEKNININQYYKVYLDKFENILNDFNKLLKILINY